MALTGEFLFHEGAGNAVSTLGGYALVPDASTSWDATNFRAQGPFTGPTGPNATVTDWSVSVKVTINSALPAGNANILGNTTDTFDISISPTYEIHVWLGGAATTAVYTVQNVVAVGGTYQITVTHTGGTTGTSKIYVNGVEQAYTSATHTGTTVAVNFNAITYLGKTVSTVMGPSPQYLFVDNLRTYNTALTVSEIAAIGTLTAQFPFSEGTGNAVSAIGGYALVPDAGTSWDTDRAKGPFTGPTGPNVIVGEWSVSCKVVINAALAAGFTNLVSHPSDTFDLDLSSTGEIHMWLGGSGTTTVYTPAGAVATGGIYYITVTHTGGTLASSRTRIYVNGVEQSYLSATHTGVTIDVNFNGITWIGKGTGANPIGPSPQYVYMDDLRIWNYQLSAAEAASITAPGLVSSGNFFQFFTASSASDGPVFTGGGTGGGPPGSTEFPFVQTAAATLGWGTPAVMDDFTVKPSSATGWNVYNGAGHAGNGTRSPNQVFIDPSNNGIMSIIGTSGGASAGMAFHETSGQFRGKWEVAMKTSPGSVNYHPVLLTWPDSQNWPTDGELDYCEILDSAARQLAHFYLHYSSTNQQVEQRITIDCTQWHAWALEWTATEINAYCDGTRYAHFTNTATFPPNAHHLCLQLDNFGGDISAGGRMDFAWIKQWP